LIIRELKWICRRSPLTKSSKRLVWSDPKSYRRTSMLVPSKTLMRFRRCTNLGEPTCVRWSQSPKKTSLTMIRMSSRGNTMLSSLRLSLGSTQPIRLSSGASSSVVCLHFTDTIALATWTMLPTGSRSCHASHSSIFGFRIPCKSLWRSTVRESRFLWARAMSITRMLTRTTSTASRTKPSL
jgi:hypothetical protein